MKKKTKKVTVRDLIYMEYLDWDERCKFALRVKTVRDLIYWEYAKMIAKSAGFEKNDRFIMGQYKKLKNGSIKMSDILREDLMQMECGKECCIYCGSKENLSYDHLIPKSKGGPNIISNMVLACRSCNSSKGNKDIFEWYADNRDKIPRLVLGKYLKLIFDFHEKAKTLDKEDVRMDGTPDVMDLVAIFNPSIPLAILERPVKK